jgi:hypothetical protein
MLCTVTIAPLRRTIVCFVVVRPVQIAVTLMMHSLLKLVHRRYPFLPSYICCDSRAGQTAAVYPHHHPYPQLPPTPRAYIKAIHRI